MGDGLGKLLNKTPSPKRGRNEESCGDREHERSVVIPPVVWVVPVGVDPLTVVAIGVEHVRVAIRVGNV